MRPRSAPPLTSSTWPVSFTQFAFDAIFEAFEIPVDLHALEALFDLRATLACGRPTLGAADRTSTARGALELLLLTANVGEFLNQRRSLILVAAQNPLRFLLQVALVPLARKFQPTSPARLMLLKLFEATLALALAQNQLRELLFGFCCADRRA